MPISIRSQGLHLSLNITEAEVDDRDPAFYENYVCGAQRNYTGYCNREVDQLVEEQSQQTDPGVRKRLVWEIEQKAPNITNAGEIAELDSLLTRRWREMDSNHLSRDKWERCSEARPMVRSPG